MEKVNKMLGVLGLCLIGSSRWVINDLLSIKTVILKNNLFELVHPCILTSRFVYKIKQRGPDLYEAKCRWTPRGFQEREGIDYNETFANVPTLAAIYINTIHIYIAYPCHKISWYPLDISYRLA